MEPTSMITLSPADRPLIEIEGIEYRYGAVKVLKGLTLTVPRGCVYALLGLNGAGKSTLMRTLLNLGTPSAGTARVLGRDAMKLRPEELAQIGYVSESQKLPDYL